MLNEQYFPKDNFDINDDFVGFKYPHLQLRNISYSVRKGRKEERILEMINVEARGGDLVAVLASSGETFYNAPIIIIIFTCSTSSSFFGSVYFTSNISHLTSNATIITSRASC